MLHRQSNSFYSRRVSFTMEERLKDLWSQVLGCEQSDLKSETNFFEFGEDSVVIIRLVRLANDTGLQLDAQTVFTNPVVSDLAALCKYSRRNPSLEVNKSGTIASRSSMDSSDVVNTCLLQCGIESKASSITFLASLPRGYTRAVLGALSSQSDRRGILIHSF